MLNPIKTKAVQDAILNRIGENLENFKQMFPNFTIQLDTLKGGDYLVEVYDEMEGSFFTYGSIECLVRCMRREMTRYAGVNFTIEIKDLLDEDKEMYIVPVFIIHIPASPVTGERSNDNPKHRHRI